MSECIGFSQNFENFEIINFENKYSLIKFKMNTDLYYCKYCDQLHAKNNTEFVSSQSPGATSAAFSFLLSSANLSKYSLLNNNSNDIFFSLKNKRAIVKKKLDSVSTALNFFKDVIQNNEQRVKTYCSQLKKQINFIHQHKNDQLAESRNQLFKELTEFSNQCIRSIDFHGAVWTDLKLFQMNHQINPNLIDYFLEAKNNDEQLDIHAEHLNNFRTKLEEKKKLFESYLFMNKSVKFEPIFSEKLNEPISQIGLFNQTEICSSENLQRSMPDIDQFNRLNEYFFSKQTALVWNYMFYEELAVKKYDQSLITIHSFDDSNKFLLCNRYAKSTETGQVCCDMSIVDLFGNLVKQATHKNSLVRCLTTNSNFILFTIESEDEKTLLKQFNLVLYDSELNFVNSIKFDSIIPLSVYMDEQKCYLLTNSLPVLNVFDMNLNLVTKLGQDINSNFPYYIPNKVDYFLVKNEKIYLQEKRANDQETCIIVLDLANGVGTKRITIPFQFNFFNIVSFDLCLFITDNSFICYDLNNEQIKYKTGLISDHNITSYCLNKMGMIVCLFHELNLVQVF